MANKLKRKIFWATVSYTVSLLLSAVSSFADSMTYTYDDLNRLKQVLYSDGTIVYDYDEVGNRLQKGVYKPITPDFQAAPTIGYSPLLVTFTDASTGNPTAWLWNFGDSSLLSTAQNPTHIYKNTGSNDLPYTAALTVSNPTGSYFISKVITVKPCATLVRIVGKGAYASLQAAYDVAAANDVIQMLAQDYTGNLNANRNISVTIEGGKTCDYLTTLGNTTFRGMMTIINGTVTVKDIVLDK